MEQKMVEKAAEFFSAKRIDGVLALIDVDSYPTASAKSVLKNDGINWLFFATGSHHKKRIDKCNHASFCYFSQEHNQEYNITLIGKIEVMSDIETRKEMWREWFGEFWTGPEDENYCVLKFVTERYKIWIGEEEVEGKF